ncbi:MAG TPA: tetratricopeptide repeat protein, partial [Aestuariivirgaceae bacterium]|nr:tetratricopeptide repeat protein [Aestuariivirgaceae bacterium]
IDSLKQRFDDMKLEPASDGDAGALRLEVEQLAATVSQASGHALGDLDARLQHLEAEFKSRTSESDPDTQRQIAELGQRIAATEARLDHLATIEHSVAQLAHSLETGSSAAAAAAGGGHAAGPSPELKALEDGLKAVRASAELADRRTQETLEAVHDTLEQIVAKLAELEAGDGPGSDGPGGEEVGEEAGEEAGEEDGEEAGEEDGEEAAEVPDEEFAGNLAANLAEEPAVSIAVAPEAEDLAMAPLGEADEMTATAPDGEGFVFPQDAPLEESGSGLGEKPRTETSDGPMSGPYVPSETADAPVREDYIAAARRAAQMAATRNRNPVTSGFNRFSQAMSGARAQPGMPGNGGAPSRGVASSLFSGLWGRKGKSGEEPQRADKKSRRNRLIVAGLVLLAAASAYGAYRHAGSVPGIDMLGGALSGREAGPGKVDAPAAPQTRRDTAPAAAVTRRSFSSEPGERTGTRPHEALTTASIAPPGAATESARPRTALAETLPSEIGPLSLRQAAIGGDAIAQFVVANRYLEGKAVARDEKQAAQWLSQAARQGLTVAQYRLGSMYEHGRGMPLDRNEAQVWYEKAAARGNITAMHNLAVLYTEPSAGQRYYELAANWFRRAAERGLKDSQYNLAVMSQQGLGVAQSPEDAFLWYSLAAAQGDQEAAAKAKALESSLASEAASRVHARLAAWRPLSIDREANMVPAGDPAWQEASAQAVAGRKTN